MVGKGERIWGLPGMEWGNNMGSVIQGIVKNPPPPVLQCSYYASQEREETMVAFRKWKEEIVCGGEGNKMPPGSPCLFLLLFIFFNNYQILAIKLLFLLSQTCDN